MKCLDKKRIKMKQGETLALNERIMLSLVSTGVSYTRQQLCLTSMTLHQHGVEHIMTDFPFWGELFL